MKTLYALTAIAAFVLCAPAAIAADQPEARHGGAEDQAKPQGQARPEAQAKPQSQSQGPARSQAQVRPQAQATPQSQPQPQVRSQAQARPQVQARSQAQVAPQGHSQNPSARASGAAPSNATRNAAARGGQTGGAHANVDIHAYQRNVTAQHQFHAASYRAPRGYSYRRWSFGQSLPAIYFGRDFWINNYDSYGLMAPPYGYVWVRFGPDALLIDQYTGEIVQVDYGMFY